MCIIRIIRRLIRLIWYDLYGYYSASLPIPLPTITMIHPPRPVSALSIHAVHTLLQGT